MLSSVAQIFIGDLVTVAKIFIEAHKNRPRIKRKRIRWDLHVDTATGAKLRVCPTCVPRHSSLRALPSDKGKQQRVFGCAKCGRLPA